MPAEAVLARLLSAVAYLVDLSGCAHSAFSREAQGPRCGFSAITAPLRAASPATRAAHNWARNPGCRLFSMSTHESHRLGGIA